MLTRHPCAFLAECRKGPSSAQSCSSFTCQTPPVAVKQNTCALFADDTLVYSTCCTPSQHPCCNLQEDIDAVQTWSSDWNATFNSAKSQQMVVGRHGCETGGNLVQGGDKLQQVCTVSHLGLTLASTLKWSDHVSNFPRADFTCRPKQSGGPGALPWKIFLLRWLKPLFLILSVQPRRVESGMTRNQKMVKTSPLHCDLSSRRSVCRWNIKSVNHRMINTKNYWK